jgi:hypothetical protein
MMIRKFDWELKGTFCVAKMSPAFDQTLAKVCWSFEDGC